MKDRRIAEPFVLTWAVHPSGYEWEQKKSKTADGDAWYLIPRDANELPRTYEPLRESTGLFKMFANLALDRNSIAAFANEYGWLGLPALPGETPYLFAESLAQWEDEILRMKPLVTLWEALRQSDSGQLAKFIHWKDGALCYDLGQIVGKPKGEIETWPGTPWRTATRWTRGARTYCPPYALIPADQALQNGLKPGDVIAPAWHILQGHLNTEVALHPTVPALIWTRRRELHLYMRAHHLAAAMWLQFACAVSENHSLRSCEVCGRFFRVGPDGDRRADALFCSNACRQKKYQDIKKRKISRPKRKRARNGGVK